MALSVASLFAGIGGFELGLERARGWRTVLQCEIEPHARAVLERHWPSAVRVEDVRTIERVDADVICAGFPCQDLSGAARGRNEGLQGARSGLWYETLRIIESSRPRAVFLENVSGSAEKRWLPHVRRDLHTAGYASVPLRVRACDVGAPQRGARTFVVASPYRDSQPVVSLDVEASRLREIASTLASRGWSPGPSTGMEVVDGIPERVALRLYGNAVVPRMAELVALATSGDS